MYSSNSSLNGNNLISYPNQAFCSRPFSFESNPSSKDAETNCPFPPPPLSFFQFEDNEIFLHDFLLHHHHHHQSLEEAAEIPGKAGQGMSTMEQIPRKRSSKRDRHSKINTARGLRDRRMRLSLEVAKRFFGLQDMLGFDKASKTVEWLLTQAKVEIKQLAREKNISIHPSCSSVGAKSASSTSECEGVSGLDEVVVSGNQEHAVVKRRLTKVSRKSAFSPVGREKARERARERTREKLRTRRQQADESKQCNDHLNSLSSCWNPFETVEESAGTHQSRSVNVNPSFDTVMAEAEAEAEERSSHAKDHSGTVQDVAHEDGSLLIMSKLSPTMVFNSLNNSGLILQQHQFAEFQSLGKPWEAYNNHI